MASKRIPPVLEWSLATLGVALAYFLFGRLALLLALPPGYAAPVWPAAGVALAAILLLGYRVWPGVFLGSLFVNVSASASPSGPEAVLVASAIGSGAVLQSTVGAYLIRRWIGFPRSFDQPRQLLLATFLAGPLNCVLGASVGVTTLLVAGTLVVDQALGSWTVWWFGDTLGVLLVLPIASAWGMELRRTRFRQRLLVGGPLLIATSLVVLLFLDTRRTEQDNARLEFERRAEIMARVIEESVAAKLDVVLSVVSLFNSSDAVTRSEFRQFVEPLIDEHAGLHGLSWNARVPAAQRLDFEAAARRDGVTGFEFTQRDTGGRLVRAGDRDDYIPVYFIEPYAGNEDALGFDLASDATLTAALARVRDSGELLATPPVALVQETDAPSGFLVFAPIYDPGQPLDTVAQRRRHLHSFVSAVFKSGQLVDNALRTFAKEGIDTRIVDVSDPHRPNSSIPVPPVTSSALPAATREPVRPPPGRPR